MREIQRIHQALLGPWRDFPDKPAKYRVVYYEAWQRVQRELEQAISQHRLKLAPTPMPQLRIHQAPEFIPDEMRPQPVRESPLTYLEVRYLDEIGIAIGGLEVVFSCDGQTFKKKTDPSGIARLDEVDASFGSVQVASVQALSDILEARWARPRQGETPTGPGILYTTLSEQLPSVQLESARQKLVVFVPEPGKIFLELYDKTGRHLHRHCDYRIDGPVSFSGRTDEHGRLRHDDVPSGDYTLELTVTYEEGLQLEPRTYKSPVVTLDGTDAEPQLRLIGAVPRVVMARVRGLVFDTNKTFILNSAVDAFKRIREVYKDNNPSELLIVGHTDTTAQAWVNDPLSLKRAEAVEQYLKDDVEAWLNNYSDNLSDSERWGAREDLQMIEAMPGYSKKAPGVDPVVWYQTQHNLKPPHLRRPKAELRVDGDCGRNTREQLIYDYMQLDGTTLRDNRDYSITTTVHGCGENFPLDDSGQALDNAPANDKEDALDRRVELFFFDKNFGILPPPPGRNSPPGSTEYLEWRRRAEVIQDDRFHPEADLYRLHDESSVPMPGAVAQVLVGEEVLGEFVANGDGFIGLRLPRPEPERLLIRWRHSGGDTFVFEQEVIPQRARLLGAEGERNALANIGYPLEMSFEDAAKAFQFDYEVDHVPEPRGLEGGQLPKRSRRRLSRILDTCDATPPRHNNPAIAGERRKLGLQLAVFVGPGAEPQDVGRLLFRDKSGTDVVVVELSEFDIEAAGLCHVAVDVPVMPDPVEILHQTSTETRSILGPCSLVELEVQLREGDLNAAGQTAFGAPE